MSVVAFIPARGGSKGIPNKNITDLNGKPLIYWSLLAVENSDKIQKVFVATDSSEIASVVRGFGFSKVEIFNRSEENAKDFSPTIDVVLEFINSGKLNEEDYLCLVQATSPLLTSTDVSGFVENFENSNSDSSLTCVESRKYHWSKDGEPIGHVFSERKPRQERTEHILVENGAMYLNKVLNIKKEKCLLSGKVIPYVMNYDTIYEIDSPFDLKIVENLMNKR